MRGRILGGTVGLALLAGLAGCVGVSGETAVQRDEVGDVEVATVVCAAALTEGTSCPSGNAGGPAGSGDYQLLLGYRIPLGVTYPESIASREGTIALLFNQSFVDELNRLAPVPAAAGQQWVGYLSPTFDYSTLGDEHSATLVARFGLVRGGDGAPWSGPFRYRTIAGYREAQPEPTRPVKCGQTLDQYSEDGTTLCQDWPTPEELPSDDVVPTRDLGVVAGARGTIRRGKTGILDFTVAYAGASASPSFTLGASTSVPGGVAGTATSTIAPASSGTTTVGVNVSVPSSTAPGDYDVTLSATLPNGQRRAATGVVTVTGPSVVDRTPPEVNVRLGKLPRIARARKVGVAPEVACSEPCRLEAELRLGAIAARRLGIRVPAGRTSITLGRTREPRLLAGRRNLRVRFSKALAPRLGRASRVALTYRVVARDASGNFRVRLARFTLRR